MNDYYYDGTLGDSSDAQRMRVIVVNDGQMNKALDILEEFGFSRERCMTAILHHQPFFTFDERMAFDIVFMKALLSRLMFEGIAFDVEEWKHHEWIKSDVMIQPKRYVRKSKEKEDNEQDDEDDESGFVSKAIATIVALMILAVYTLWIMIFPINLFKPVRW